jgi:hypothetical protein
MHKNIVKLRKKVATISIFHTHPHNSKPYPSIEDIVKLLKHRDIVCRSFIATSWGLWTISNTARSTYYATETEDKRKQLVEFLDKTLAKLYELNGKHSTYAYIPEVKSEEYTLIKKVAEKIGGVCVYV